MRFVDEFRDRNIARDIGAQIARLGRSGREYRFMEVCGGHTHTIYKHGIEDYLPPHITLVHGPGCPVCVIPMGRVDDAIYIAHQQGVIMTCFGDMMRVPGTRGTPLEHKARGADVRMVYSPLDALRLAQENPDRHVSFFAIGFETTAPSTALTLLRARELGIRNFSVFCNHVTIVPAIRAILDSPEGLVDLGDELALAVPGAQLKSPVGFRRGAVGQVGMILSFTLEMRQRLPRFAENIFLPVQELLLEVLELTLVHEFLVLGRTVLGPVSQNGGCLHGHLVAPSRCLDTRGAYSNKTSGFN